MGRLQVSMSQLPLADHEYTNGEIHKLIAGSPIWQAIHQEEWLNCGPETKAYYVDRLAQPHYFSGYVISLVRGQIELTYVPLDPATGGPGDIRMISITIFNVRRFA